MMSTHRNAADAEEVAIAVAGVRAKCQELLRRSILEDERLDFLATEILSYEIRPFHGEMLKFQAKAKKGCLQLAPRGYGKSTILNITRALFEVLRNPDIRILIASNTQLQAEVFLREIKFHLQHNPRFQEHFGAFYSDEKWDSREICVAPRTISAKEATITCVGVGGPVASRHYDLIIADDLVDEENARTGGQREKVHTWFYKTLLPCLEPKGRLYVIGTRYHWLDLYGHLIKNEFGKKHQVIRAIARDGSTPWPEKFPLTLLEERRQQMGSTLFNTQYQNDVSLMTGSIFKEEWIRFFGKDDPPYFMRSFIGCDPAATRRDLIGTGREARSDWWTIVVGARGYDHHGECQGPVYLLDVWRGRVTKQAYVDQLKKFKEIYNPEIVCIESTAAQEYLAQDLEAHMPVERLQRTTDKVTRGYWLQSYLENGEILFPARELTRDWEPWEALIEELLLFPDGEHDDLFDALQAMMEGAVKGRRRGGFAFGVL